jgi:phospholipid/cholesterol/gamma-HCH transport system permease protein
VHAVLRRHGVRVGEKRVARLMPPTYRATGMHWRVYVDSAFSTLRLVDVIVDTGKTSIFGFIVGIVACYRGYTVRGGTREVGQAAMQAVVLASLLILVADVVVVRCSILIFGDIAGGG